jgi:hypothetical protein
MDTLHIELELTPEQIGELRQVIDHLPLNPYGPLICAVLKGLPMLSEDGRGCSVIYRNGRFESVAVTRSGADAVAAPVPSREPRSFSLTALTPKGRALLPEVEHLLSRLPHGEGSL